MNKAIFLCLGLMFLISCSPPQSTLRVGDAVGGTSRKINIKKQTYMLFMFHVRKASNGKKYDWIIITPKGNKVTFACNSYKLLSVSLATGESMECPCGVIYFFDSKTKKFIELGQIPKIEDDNIITYLEKQIESLEVNGCSTPPIPRR